MTEVREAVATIDLDFGPAGHLYATHPLHAFAARCPPPLVDWAISCHTRPGDVVLDPMVGSGTTLVEAALLGRRAWGVDIDPLARLIAKAKATPVPAPHYRSLPHPSVISRERQDLRLDVAARSVLCWRDRHGQRLHHLGGPR